MHFSSDQREHERLEATHANAKFTLSRLKMLTSTLHRVDVAEFTLTHDNVITLARTGSTS